MVRPIEHVLLDFVEQRGIRRLGQREGRVRSRVESGRRLVDQRQQRATVELAHSVHREPLEDLEASRYRLQWQRLGAPPAQIVPQHREVDGTRAVEHDEREKFHRVVGREVRQDVRLAHVRVGAKDAGDLARIDPEAAELDLVVGATEDLDEAVGASDRAITAEDDSVVVAMREGVGDKASGRRLGVIRVPHGKIAGPYGQLARLVHVTQGGAALVEDQQLGAGQRVQQWLDARMWRIGNLVPRSRAARLGRAPEVRDTTAPRYHCAPCLDQRVGKRLAAEERPAQRRPGSVGISFREPRANRGRGRGQNGASRLRHPGDGLLGQQQIGGYAQRRPRGQRAEHAPQGADETDVRDERDAVGGR